MQQPGDRGRRDAHSAPIRAAFGDDPASVGNPSRQAANHRSRHGDADDARARVADMDRVTRRGDPAAGGRLRQADSSDPRLPQRQPLLRPGQRVHDARTAEGDGERAAAGAERLGLVDQVAAREDPAARIRAAAVRHVLPDSQLLPDIVVEDAEAIGNSDLAG